MCIICFKPAGEPLPSDEAIKHMFSTNPHGAGYALQGYLKGSKKFTVMYKKGFMKVEDLIKSLHEEGNDEYLRRLNIAIHFRIKTHGETDQKTTHPFTITGDFKKTQKLHGVGKPVLFHNGIFPELGGITNEKASDTQDYVIGVANKYLKTPNISKVGQTIAQIVAGDCRVLIMYPNERCPVVTIGKWHKFDNLMYSNTGYYDPTRPTYGSSYGYYHGYYGYDDEYYKDKYYRNRKKYENNNKVNHTEDRFGRNIHELAYPSSVESWILCTDSERYNLLASQAKLIYDDDDETGLQLVHFPYNPDEKWYMDRYTLQIFRDQRLDEYMDLLELKQAYEDLGAELDDDYLNFADANEMEYWLNMTKKTDCPYEFNWAGKTWMVDTIMLEAFTREGLREEYKEGAIGHAEKYLREEGTLYNKPQLASHRKSAKDLIKKEELDELFPDDDLPALIETRTTKYNGA